MKREKYSTHPSLDSGNSAAINWALGEWQTYLDSSQIRKVPTLQLIPHTEDQVVSICKIAHQYTIHLIPLLYGKPFQPITQQNEAAALVKIELSQLKNIQNFQSQHGLVSVEPGVSYKELQDVVDANQAPYMIPKMSSGDQKSLLGSYLKSDGSSWIRSFRGVFLTGEKFEMDITNGFPPSLSNAIITQGTICLEPKPEKVKGFFFSLKDSQNVNDAINAIKIIMKNAKGLTSPIRFVNAADILGEPNNQEDGPVISQPDFEDHWMGVGTIYGDAQLTESMERWIKDKLHPFSEKLFFLTSTRIKKGMAVLNQLPHPQQNPLWNIMSGLEKTVDTVGEIFPNSHASVKILKPTEPQPKPYSRGLQCTYSLLPEATDRLVDFIGMVQWICHDKVHPRFQITCSTERTLEVSIYLAVNTHHQQRLSLAYSCFETITTMGKKEGYLAQGLRTISHHTGSSKMIEESPYDIWFKSRKFIKSEVEKKYRIHKTNLPSLSPSQLLEKFLDKIIPADGIQTIDDLSISQKNRMQSRKAMNNMQVKTQFATGLCKEFEMFMRTFSLPQDRPIKILQVQPRSGSVLKTLHEMAKTKGYSFELTGLERDLRDAKITQKILDEAGVPAKIIHADGYSLKKFKDNEFDFILTAHFIRSVGSAGELGLFLLDLQRVCSLGWFLNDLERRPTTPIFILSNKLFTKIPDAFHKDSLIASRRSYKAGEVDLIIKEINKWKKVIPMTCESYPLFPLLNIKGRKSDSIHKNPSWRDRFKLFSEIADGYYANLFSTAKASPIFKFLHVCFIPFYFFLFSCFHLFQGLRRFPRKLILLVKTGIYKSVAGITSFFTKDESSWMGRQLQSIQGEIKELEKTRKSFSSEIVHDLKSPLLAIDGFVKMIQKDSGSLSQDTIQNSMLTIQNNTHRLMDLVDDLLISSRLESGREEPDRKEFNLSRLVKDIEKLYQPIAAEKKIVFQSDLPPEPPFVWADPNHVYHILNNLLSNALKFTKEGSVRILIDNKKSDVLITISDTGCGIDESQKEKIFEKFYKSKSVDNIKGTGLGLYIIKGLIQAQCGTISVQSKPNKGSQFSFTLPKKS